MAQTQLSTVLRGRDVSWIDRYPKAVDAVTLLQVNTAIKQHLNPEKMISVKTGTLPKACASPLLASLESDPQMRARLRMASATISRIDQSRWTIVCAGKIKTALAGY